MEVELKRGAVNILNNLLQGTRWYTSTKAAYLAGQILTEVIPELEGPPKTATDQQATGEVLNNWLRTPFKLNFTPAQAKTAGECIKFFLDSKDLPPGEYVMNLMDVFKLKPEGLEE